MSTAIPRMCDKCHLPIGNMAIANASGTFHPECAAHQVNVSQMDTAGRLGDAIKRIAELEAALSAERARVIEECARVAGEKSAMLPHQNDFVRGYANGRADAAAAIRALGQQDNGNK